jgi:hypothetical protein
MGILHENILTFLTISCKIFVRVRNVLDKSCRESKNTHFVQ